ncbi:MAG: hypothetical protein AzoDbin1_05373 [Azoarcus sp.]|nr:hypothetical protein [Azoarcus sp.]
MDDILALFGDDPAAAQAQAKAMADAMRQRRAAGTLATILGGPFAAAGKTFSGDADALQQQLVSSGQQRAGLGLQRQRLTQEGDQQKATEAYRTAQLGLDRERLNLDRSRVDQDAWGAVADPVTGGIVMFNKKTGEVKPLGPGGGTPAPPQTGGPRPPALLPGKPTEAQRKAVAGASESITQLDMAIDALGKAPGAYGGAGNFIAGLAESAGGTPVQSLTARRYSPDELRVKNYVSNVVSKIINERAGANVTLREELRQKFLPQDTDGLDQAKQKLGDLRAMVAASYEAQGGGALSAPESSTTQPQMVKVRRKSDGKTGRMPAATFNPDLYEQIQ